MVLKNLSRDKILLALVVGILLFLLSFPLEKLGSAGDTGDLSENQPSVSGDTRSQYQAELEKELKALLENVQGAGNVKVMVVLEDGGEKIVEKDVQSESSSSRDGEENGSSGENFSSQENTVMENGQTPWISREILPRVSGIAVVAQGGGNAVVKSEISSMLEALFGLPAHKIKVLEGDF
ncbi:MAG: hypothetical protein PUG60_15865 [Lachnospiraceae bacterium]|nr:hypothetical protein [Lachnospiraceae bacterium]MDY4971471.1 hypothetical protein [Lachnospiraceae bacterium]